MYIEKIEIQNFRTFRKIDIDFLYKQRPVTKELPTSKFPNINVVLGINGNGKTTLLKAVALAALGPAVTDSGIYPYHLVRKEPKKSKIIPAKHANLKASFIPHKQDEVSNYEKVESDIAIVKKGDLEQLRWSHHSEKPWHPIYSSTSDAFFFVGYGTNRRVEKKSNLDLGSRSSNIFSRAQRIKSIFEDSYSLIPLNVWLPSFESKRPYHFQQVIKLINKLVGKNHYQLTTTIEAGEYLFEKRGLKIPFPALSDGYKGFLGWVADLMYHICSTCPRDKSLTAHKGIVMVDEIDLHLHPEWQKQVLPILSKVLPNIQFIVTTHSPLIVSSVEWMNIITMVTDKHQASKAKRVPYQINGLDADQVLISDFFGLSSTRTELRSNELKKLTLKSGKGDKAAAKELLKMLVKGK